ncbi:MAG: hypothetical protein JJT78_07940 [Leptospira sp.]|nr:hypothetical protein [Leptospira sp.]
MDKNFKNHLATIIVGIFLGIGFLLIHREIPDEPVLRNHSGLTSTILGISLANIPDDIYGILGGPENEEFMSYIEQFKSVLLYQIVLIVLYVIFFLQIIGFSYRNSEKIGQVYFLSGLLILSALGDIGENFQLQAILDANSEDKMLQPLALLSWFTNLKWGLLFAIAGYLSMRLWLYEKGIILKTQAIFMQTAFLFWLSSFIRLNLIELGILFLILSFILFWIYSLLIIVLSKKT